MPTADLPRLGLGTYSDADREQWRGNVRTALDVGYRHVDTAQDYDNEQYVGRGIRDADLDREDVFLATKVAPPNLAGEDLLATTRESLDRLGVGALDLLYVHWPHDAYDPESTLAALDRLHDEGRVRNVGLSNFTPGLLEEAIDLLDAPLAAHQVELHPYLPQDELVAHAREHDYWVVAYSPLAQGRVLDDPVLADVAEKHDATPAQVALAWLLSRENVAAIPKASSREHMADNLAARDLELDETDVERIDGLDRRERVIDPSWARWND
jgi:2,5-diketo-D-gluconate reductase B